MIQIQIINMKSSSLVWPLLSLPALQPVPLLVGYEQLQHQLLRASRRQCELHPGPGGAQQWDLCLLLSLLPAAGRGPGSHGSGGGAYSHQAGRGKLGCSHHPLTLRSHTHLPCPQWDSQDWRACSGFSCESWIYGLTLNVLLLRIKVIVRTILMMTATFANV